ncbi:unnamed protein product [Ambrosiozyma monospora]|uniref:Unnamed protein product n=1 Tax=Ambrosiozyma monospora TaxID=43982 RepID=A0ACB5T394_AMBMO|nr:unnamed protein product [Ambrosiozyma monospora]
MFAFSPRFTSETDNLNLTSDRLAGDAKIVRLSFATSPYCKSNTATGNGLTTHRVDSSDIFNGSSDGESASGKKASVSPLAANFTESGSLKPVSELEVSSDGDVSDSHGDFFDVPNGGSSSCYTSPCGSESGSASGANVHVPAPRSSSPVSRGLRSSTSSSSSCNSDCDFNGRPSHLQSIDTRASLYAKTTRPSTEHEHIPNNSVTSLGIQPDSPSFDTLASVYSKLSPGAKSKSKSKAKFMEYKAKANGDGCDCTLTALTGVRCPSHSSDVPSFDTRDTLCSREIGTNMANTSTGNVNDCTVNDSNSKCNSIDSTTRTLVLSSALSSTSSHSSQSSTPPPRPSPPPFSLASILSSPDSTPMSTSASKFTKTTLEPETIPEGFELFADSANRETIPYNNNNDTTCLSPAQEYHIKMQRQQLELQLLQRQKQKLIEQQQQIDQKLQISNWALCQSQPSTPIGMQTLPSHPSQPEKLHHTQSPISAFEPLNLVPNDPLPLPPYTQKKGKIRDSDRPAVQLYNEKLKDGKIKYSCEYYSAYVYDIGDSFDTLYYNRGFSTGGRVDVENWFGYGKDADGGSIGFKV